MSTNFTQNSNSKNFFGRILVIDDEPHVLSLACMMLKSQNFDVVGAESGDQGIQVLVDCMNTERQINTVVLDLTMPSGMSGFDTLEQLHALSPDLPVIACSGYFQEDARELCQSIGFADVLQKPYALEHLCDVVRRHIVRDRISV